MLSLSQSNVKSRSAADRKGSIVEFVKVSIMLQFVCYAIDIKPIRCST